MRDKAMSAKKTVQLRLPQEIIDRVKRAARYAGITPTEGFVFILGLEIARQSGPAPAGRASVRGKKEKAR